MDTHNNYNANDQNRTAPVKEVIREKGPVGKAQETLSYLGELESLHAEIRRKLYGSFPQEGQCGDKSTHEPSLEEMLTGICQRTAMAVGDAKNLLSKLD